MFIDPRKKFICCSSQKYNKQPKSMCGTRKGPGQPKQYWEKEENQKHHTSRSQIALQITVKNWYWHWHIDHWSWMESPELNSEIQCQRVFNIEPRIPSGYGAGKAVETHAEQWKQTPTSHDSQKLT